MVNLKIDDKNISVEDGTSILDAAKSAGIEIPTMCHLAGLVEFTSCLVCVVKDKKTGKIIPSCSIKVVEGMELENDSEEVSKSRRTALELLLGEHIGDCVAPCQRTCPAHMNIPKMIRLIERGDDREALELVKETIALPAILGRICPAPCEKACRRGKDDKAVSICLLKGHSAEVDIESGSPYIPNKSKNNGKTVAVIGSGPAGLSAAYYLLILGYSVDIYEKVNSLGGNLIHSINENRLPKKVMDNEIDIIVKMGAEIKKENPIASNSEFQKLTKSYDATIIASGSIEKENCESLYGLDYGKSGILVDKKTFQTSLQNIFAIGGAVMPGKLAVRSGAHGKSVALSIDTALTNAKVSKDNSIFVVLGKVAEDEMAQFKQGMAEFDRVDPMGESNRFKTDEARDEAKRCLRCDCAKPDSCKLRIYSDEYGAKLRNYAPIEREHFRRVVQHETVIYEPGKCINCGICVRITEKADVKFGMAFIGRGYDVDVKVPFAEPMNEGLGNMADECVNSCPTGALYFKKDTDYKIGE